MRRMLENPALLPYFKMTIRPEDEEPGTLNRTIQQDGFYTITVVNANNVSDVNFTVNFTMPVIVDAVNIAGYMDIVNSWNPTIENNLGWYSAPAYNLRDGYGGSDTPGLEIYDIPAGQNLTLNIYVANGIVRGFNSEV